MADTIYWYDYETTGIDPVVDRPIQFAGVRTDLELKPVADPQRLYCRLSGDVLPSPEAMLISRISLHTLDREGICEAQFMEKINGVFSAPHTCVAGYNSIRFDDEFTRQALYRNLLDPYAREWQGGNSRWDVIDLFRTAYALRPEGMEWPMGEAGRPSFRLEDLARANGIQHEAAHDALSDVNATIALSARLRSVQPRLYDYLFRLRAKQQVLGQLYPLGKSPILHISGMYPAANGCLGVVLPICTHPTNSNGVIVYNLATDPAPLLRSSAEEVHRLMFTRGDELPDEDERIPLKTVHINRCPALAPLSTLTAAAGERLGLDLDLCRARVEAIQHTAGIVEKIQQALSLASFPAREDPDFMLYQGDFFSQQDRELMAQVRQRAAAGPLLPPPVFTDPRLEEMAFRFRARSYPESLTAAETQRWSDFLARRWQGGDAVARYLQEIQQLQPGYRDRPEELALLDELHQYGSRQLSALQPR